MDYSRFSVPRFVTKYRGQTRMLVPGRNVASEQSDLWG